MKIVLDFVSGKIDPEEFKSIWYNNPEIGLWLDNLIDLHTEPQVDWLNLPYHEFRLAIHKHYNGSVLKYINASETFRSSCRNLPKWLDIGWQFHPIAAVVVVAFPGVIPTTYYDEEQTFYNAVISDNIGGQEVDGLIAGILSQFPRTLGKTKRKKEARAAIKKAFHIEERRYPQWAQEAEWPMGERSPMAFVSQKRDGDLIQFVFRDVDTNQTRVIEQLY